MNWGGGGLTPPPPKHAGKNEILQKEILIWLFLVHKLLDFWVPNPPPPPPHKQSDTEALCQPPPPLEENSGRIAWFPASDLVVSPWFKENPYAVAAAMLPSCGCCTESVSIVLQALRCCTSSLWTFQKAFAPASTKGKHSSVPISGGQIFLGGGFQGEKMCMQFGCLIPPTPLPFVKDFRVSVCPCTTRVPRWHRGRS